MVSCGFLWNFVLRSNPPEASLALALVMVYGALWLYALWPYGYAYLQYFWFVTDLAKPKLGTETDSTPSAWLTYTV